MGASSPPNPGTARAMWIGIGLATIAVALLNFGAWTTEPIAGGDVMFHLIRTEEGIELLTEGRIHGWSDRYFTGSDLFLFYGPGLVWLVALFNMASLGMLDIGASLTVVVLLSLLLVPAGVAFLARSLGLSHRVAGIAALLSPIVSTVWGVGLEGVYQHGLITHQLGVVLWLLALGGVVRVCLRREFRWILLTSVCAAYLAITSPVLLSVLAVASGIGVLAIHLAWKLGTPAVLRLLRSVVLAVGLAAFWLIPALGHSDLRGASTWWGAIPPLEFLGYAFFGGIVLPPVVGVAVIVAMFLLVRARHPSSWFLVLLPLTYVGVEMASYFLPVDNMLLAQFQNHRGLGTIGLLMVIPLAWLLDDLGGRRSLWRSGRATTATMCVLAIVVCLIMLPKAGLARPYPDPLPQMDRAAVALAELVPAGARFAFVRDQPDEEENTATIAPKHWLAHASGVPLLNGVGLETTRAIQAYWAGEDIGRVSPAVSSTALIRHGATHVVTTRQDQADELVASGLFETVWWDPPLTILAVSPSEAGNPAAGLTGRAVVSARMSAPQRDRLVYDVETSQPGMIYIALGWSPHWVATIDGTPTTTHATDEWMTRIQMPAGTHVVELRYSIDRLEWLGVIATLATIAVLLLVGVGALVRNQRIERRL